MKNFLILLFMLILPTVSHGKVKGYYKVSLKSVDVSLPKGVITNGVNEEGFTTPSYNDSLLSVIFEIEPTHIDFIMENKGNKSIKIFWDDAVYVGGESGLSTGIFHSGVKLNDRENPQTPTVIIKKSKISDVIVPKNSVSFSDYFKRWMYSYILFWKTDLKEIKVLLPIEISGTVHEYLFIFSVDWEDIKVKTRIYDGKEYYIKKK